MQESCYMLKFYVIMLNYYKYTTKKKQYNKTR